MDPERKGAVLPQVALRLMISESLPLRVKRSRYESGRDRRWEMCCQRGVVQEWRRTTMRRRMRRRRKGKRWRKKRRGRARRLVRRSRGHCSQGEMCRRDTRTHSRPACFFLPPYLLPRLWSEDGIRHCRGGSRCSFRGNRCSPAAMPAAPTAHVHRTRTRSARNQHHQHQRPRILVRDRALTGWQLSSHRFTATHSVRRRRYLAPPSVR